MKNQKTILFVAFLGLTLSSFAQKITILEGDLGVLKGQSILNIEYDYSKMAIGKYKTEAEYVNKRVEDLNAKEAGKGDKWKENWEGDRIGRFQPQFEQLMNKHVEKLGLYVGNEKAAKYTMIVRTTFIEPGFNIYITKKFASIDCTIDIVETDNPKNVVCTIVSKSNPGRTYGMDDYDTGLRIAESYELAGKKLGIFFTDKLYEKKKK